MDHLTAEELIEFVSFEKIDGQSMKLAVRVNTHIRNCADCMGKVRSYQCVYDEFVRLARARRRDGRAQKQTDGLELQREFRQYLCEKNCENR